MSQPQPDDVDLPDALAAYYAQRETARLDAVAELLARLTERERLLVREAAVMGWVQGMRHHDTEYPGDRQALITVVDACIAFSDLYPTITRYEPTDQES
ncbi:hypothetical protein ACFVFS_17500 [Kitasatospora sp. NPDC057692]|uniref:hypothetical protein n=1 Tax=Kitasatospora sp. NPDC057692 TaxID=3346215 RepID=UPI0036B24A63